MKVPEIIESLLKEGIEIKKADSGRHGAKNGRKTFNRNVSASGEEVECFKRIVEGEWKSFISWFRMIRPLTSEACFSEAGQNLIWRR